MADLTVAIPKLRESVAAILRLRMTKPQTVEEGKVQPAQFEYGWGSAFSVVSDRYLVTAFHVLNEGKPRNLDAKFYALVVPGNGDPFFTFPVGVSLSSDRTSTWLFLRLGHAQLLVSTFQPCLYRSPSRSTE